MEPLELDKPLEKKRINAPILTSSEKIEVVKRFAWFWTPSEILQWLKDTYGKTMTSTSIKNYIHTERWEPLFLRFREEYSRDLNAVPLANKRKRLDELQKIYDLHIRSGEYHEARETIKDFRDEMEAKLGGDKFSFVQINNHTEFRELSDEQIAEEKTKALAQLEKARKMRAMIGVEETRKSIQTLIPEEEE